MTLEETARALAERVADLEKALAHQRQLTAHERQTRKAAEERAAAAWRVSMRPLRKPGDEQ